MRILVLALGVPFPPVGGGLTRTFELLRSLSGHHEVVLGAFTYGAPYRRPPYPVRIEPVPWQWSQAYRDMMGADLDASRRAFERLTYQVDEPWFVSVMDPAPMEVALDRILRTRPDLVMLEGMPLARFQPSLPADVPLVLDLFDVHSLMARRAADQRLTPDREALAWEAERTLVFEKRAAQRSDACLAVSDDEAAVARSLLGAARVHVVPNGVDTSSFVPSPAPPEAGAVLFTGRMSYRPNEDAACYFAETVLPLVRREVPHARFHVVGDGPADRVAALASAAVVVHGRVDDIRRHQWHAEVVVVPVREGGGTRLKVLEAAACGKPIVSTRLGVEGLAFRDGRDLLVADSAEDFAAAVVELLRAPERRADLGVCAREVACRYDWAAIGESLRRIVEDVAIVR